MTRRRGALLLDLDGVLFDSEPVHCRAWEACLAELGVQLPPGWYRSQRGRSLEEVAAALVEGFAPGATAPRLAARKRRVYRTLAFGLPPSPGVTEALAEQQLQAAVVSSSPGEEVRVLLRGSPLEPLLDAVVTRDDVTAPKPSPEGYLRAMLRLGLTAEQCVAVEDSEPGVSAARAAGLRVVGVAGSAGPPPGATWWRGTSAEAIRLAGATLSP